MNHIHRLIWNSASNTWVAVAENARGRGKSSGRKLVAAALSLVFTCAQAGPLGGVVASGAGTITQAGSATTIVQTTPNLSLNWKSFNVGATESVKFVQPSTNSVAVNRIFDANGSQILGRLSANGQVYLINPNGILFGKGAQVNVGGLVASTLGFNDASLGANARVFSGSSLGSVVNLGSITTAEGGFVALLGNTVSNQGTITAPRGKVMLGGASAATLNFANNALVSMKIDLSVFNTLVENGGLIKADGGSVALTAGTQTSKAPGVVRQVGYIQARTLNNQNGIITLLSGMAAGTVYVDGTLDASAPQGGNGGFIETSAAKVRIGNDVKVSTTAAKGLSGKWLIDPTDFTISAIDPGNGDGFMSSATLAANLKTGDVAIQTSAAGSGNGDINVNDAISWNTDHVLTLTAAKNINVNANITATGNTAGMVMSVAGTYRNGASITLSGATPTLKIAGIDYTVINSLGAAGSITGKDLQGIGGAMAGSYALGSNIDARPAANWNANTGFMPISSFAGTLDGLGHSITDLTMDSGSNLGLMSTISAAGSVKNIGLVNVNIKGTSSLGGLAAINAGTVSNSYSTGIVSGTSSVGGLIGSITTGTVSNSYSMANVFGTTFVGGLAGSNAGLVNNIYATGNVNAASTIGGLFGHNAGTVNDSLATGNVTGTGGTAGGLTGSNAGTVNNSYAVGKVVGGPAPNGGLMGTNAGTVNNSYWDTSTSGQLTSAVGAIPLNTTQMQTQASFNGWDFTNTWGINAGASTPYLKSMLNHVTVTANNTGKTYDGKAFTGNIGVSYSNFPDVFSLGAVSNIGLSNSATNVGTYAITPFAPCVRLVVASLFQAEVPPRR